jgi:DCN1-like protein 1/2
VGTWSYSATRGNEANLVPSCDTLEKQKAYSNDNLKSDLANSKETYTKVYQYTFQLAKPAGQKAVPLDHATTYWELLFTSPLSAVQWKSETSDWTTWWIEFLNSEWKRSINKDVWNQTLKFAMLTLEDESMSFWSEEASWPSVIDEFVEWVKKEKRGNTATDAMQD